MSKSSRSQVAVATLLFMAFLVALWVMFGRACETVLDNANLSSQESA